MPNDEHPAPANQDAELSDPPRTCWEACARAHDQCLQPYRPPRRHRGDRRLAGPPGPGWGPLDPIDAGNLSWPAARLS